MLKIQVCRNIKLLLQMILDQISFIKRTIVFNMLLQFGFHAFNIVFNMLLQIQICMRHHMQIEFIHFHFRPHIWLVYKVLLLSIQRTKCYI